MNSDTKIVVVLSTFSTYVLKTMFLIDHVSLVKGSHVQVFSSLNMIYKQTREVRSGV